PPAFPKVIQALLSADLIIAGPGSLYTSILPNLLVPDITAALRASPGFKVYVCNVATQPGETQGFTCHDHVQALEEHIGSGLFDLVVHNNCFEGKLPEDVQWVTLGDDANIDYPVYQANLTDDDQPWHHNSEKLASVLIDLLQARTGPLAE
ncbi:MAG: YvcK family protein, partial [Chloroflexi bacterium]|nr:YvcK family protein [Chloroflexota bacterium]